MRNATPETTQPRFGAGLRRQEIFFGRRQSERTPAERSIRAMVLLVLCIFMVNKVCTNLGMISSDA